MPSSKSLNKGATSLGRTIIKDRFKSKGSRHTDQWISPAEAVDLRLKDEVLLKSVTASSDLDEFLSTAKLAGTEFEAERYNVKLMAPNPRAGVLSASEQKAVRELHGQHKELLCIPRRPPWNTAMSHEELDEKERKSFLDWRQQLAELADIETLTVTPYEKNLEVWKQLWRVLERSDIVVQIVDCRNPLLYWCEDLTKYVKELDAHKDNVILLNKADLLPESQRIAWANYFNLLGRTALFFSAIAEEDKIEEERLKNFGEQTATEMVPDGDQQSDDDSDTSTMKDGDGDEEDNWEDTPDDPADLLGPNEQKQRCTSKIYSREELIQVLRSLHDDRKRVMKDAVTVGFVGYPNVGKSSTLNCIMQHKRVSVSATPGKTKHFQTMYVDDELMLCDSPGLVMPSFALSGAEMTCSGILPIDQLRDHIPPINLICSRVPRHVLEGFYGISMPLVREYGVDYHIIPPPTAEEFLNAYASKRGFVTARGLPDASRTARLVLKDYVNGKLLYCFGPPGMSQEEFFAYPEEQQTGAELQTREEPVSSHPAANSTSRSAKIDKVFFAEVTSGIYQKRNGIAGVRGPVAAVGDGTLSKKHGNRNKKEKLRRIYRDLDVH